MKSIAIVAMSARDTTTQFGRQHDGHAIYSTPPMPNQQTVWDQTYELRKNHYTRIVTEGDSWFCYPMWRSMMDFVSQSGMYALCRRGESGRLLKEIVDEKRYRKAIDAEHPAALLISGSGNDFVNHRFVTGADGKGVMFNKYVPGATVEDLINEAKWEGKLNELADYFDEIVGQVGGLPIVTHGYDYIVVSGHPAAYDGLHVAGPWIKPTMTDQGIPEDMQQDIAHLMIDSLNLTMASVASTHPSFVHVDLRGTVAPKDWANEIHPYREGFEALAKKYLKAIKGVLEQVA